MLEASARSCLARLLQPPEIVRSLLCFRRKRFPSFPEGRSWLRWLVCPGDFLDGRHEFDSPPSPEPAPRGSPQPSACGPVSRSERCLQTPTARRATGLCAVAGSALRRCGHLPERSSSGTIHCAHQRQKPLRREAGRGKWRPEALVATLVRKRSVPVPQE